MSAHSLALVFAPNLIWTPTQLTLSGKTLEDFSSVLLFMINNCYEVFEVCVYVHAHTNASFATSVLCTTCAYACV